MIFVLGIWAFVRALLVSSAAVSLENVALAINSPSCSDPSVALHSAVPPVRSPDGTRARPG